MIEKAKRKSEVRDFGTPGKHNSVKKCEGNEFRTPIILSSRTKSIEKPAPKSIYLNKASEGGHTGVGRVIKYLNARDACMQNDVSKVMQTCELPVKHASGMCGLKKLIRIFFRGFTYSVFILFILLSILSLNTLIENKYSKLVEISELITSVTIPSVEDIYFFSKESKESVREAFRYLSGNKDVDLLSVREKKKQKERKRGQELSELSKNENEANSFKLGFHNQSFFDLGYDGLSIEHYDSSSASADANYEIVWRKELIKDGNSRDQLKCNSEIQDKKNSKSSPSAYPKKEQEQKKGLESIKDQFHLTKLVEIILGQSQLKEELQGESASILELLCYQNFSFQEGILSMYYRENDHGIPFKEYFLKSDQKVYPELVKRLLNKRILNLLGIERQYELYITPSISHNYNHQVKVNSKEDRKSEFHNLFRVSRRVIVSSGYGNEEIRGFCEYQNNWICTKYEMLVLKLLLEYYKGAGETFISYFLSQYKSKIVDKNLLDNIPFFTKDQIVVINNLFPGLFTSFQRLTNSIYSKIDDFERRKKRYNHHSKYYFDKVTQEEINWIISLVLSHSLQDKDGNIAFVPYFNIIPHNSVKAGDGCSKAQTVIHHPSELSFDWNFSKSLDNGCDHRSENTKKNDYTMIYSFYGHLNNIKSVVQYGKLLYKNEYSTVWFMRKDEKNTYGFKVLFGTSTILNTMNNSLAYKDNLPNWLLNLSSNNNTVPKIQINMDTQFVHYISNTRKIPIRKNNKELGMKYLECNEYTFYNGMGLGFGTIQFTKSSLVGGINGSVYVCLREIIFRNIQQKRGKAGILASFSISEGVHIQKEKKEEILANIIHSNCVKRSTQLEDVKNLLMHQLSQKIEKEEDLRNFSSKIKQEIRVNIKLLYATMEELTTMRKCVSYFEDLIFMISQEKIKSN
ncbi:transmembrane domain [Cryptosporidium sp. chipmunk genotype I]|uniref:transmembrane domain n=1 Tax=Cryptosporidium sp. chipmunk genotype I TaxID=1280935 RepID=UPI00351A8ABA|nr:transmembrane domain [Cryptosporidium sp. chipmunk genotype I]